MQQNNSVFFLFTEGKVKERDDYLADEKRHEQAKNPSSDFPMNFRLNGFPCE